LSTGITYRELSGWKYSTSAPLEFSTECFPLNTVRTGHDYLVLDPTGKLCIKKDYAWNGPSGPARDTPNFQRASLVHDAFYQLIREGLLDPKWRLYADKLMRQMCLEDGMWRIRAWYSYQAVRLFGWLKVRPEKPRPIITIEKGVVVS